MKRSTELYLASAGMVCSVGLGARAACAAMRAGIAQFDELPYTDRSGTRIVGATVPAVDLDLDFGQRHVEMLAMSLRDCLDQIPNVELQSVPLVIGLSEIGRLGGVVGDDMVLQAQNELRCQFHPQLSTMIPSGHTAAIEGLRIARRIFADVNVPGCIVCGVDSYINGSSLRWLQQNSRLKVEDNSDGVIPGEAAAAVYVQREPPHNDKPAVQVIGLGFGRENATVLAQEPLLGLGLTSAARAALEEANLQMHEIDFRLSDVTGESYGFREQAITLSRLMRVRREELPIWHSADSIGDCGAAAGVCQLVMARESFINGYAPGKNAACYTSAVLGDRAVAVLCSTGPSPS